MIPWNDIFTLLDFAPVWLAYLIFGVTLAYTAAVVGVVIGKAGYSPFFGFFAMLPWLAIPMLAFVAWGRWRKLPNRDYREQIVENS